MKTEGQFNYEEDIEYQLVNNHHNLISLFEKKFQSEIQAQNRLIINCLTDKEFKVSMLEYIKLPEIQQELKEELENNVFITEFLRLSHENEKNFPNLDKLMVKMCQKLEKKAGNHNEPITFYNEYVEMSDKIQSCFLLRKGIKEDVKGIKEDVNNQDEVVDGKCGLKMKKYFKHYRFDHHCIYCKNGFKNQSGLRSHQNTCKKREKVKEIVVKKRQASRRCSKKRHQNLDEQKMLKLK